MYAGGDSDETEIDPLYAEWTLALTRFDVSALPPEKQIIENLVTRTLIDELSTINTRIRSDEETAYYGEYALRQARLKAGQTLKLKRDARDALLFVGDSDYTYNNKLKKIDEEIEALEVAYNIAETDFPLVTEQPIFSLSKQNLSGTFPPAPEMGMEKLFCREQNIDGFLTGTISEYYGRLYVTIELYAAYDQSFIYEDYALFSVEDQQTALADLSARLKSVLSGTESAAIIVKAEPQNAIIMINDNYAGRGSSGEIHQDEGSMNIEVFADGYHTEEFQVDIFSGELAELSINLQPIAYEAFNLDTSGGLSSSVYLGSTFMGMTPLTLNLLPDQLDYVSMESNSGESTSFIYDGTNPSAVVTLLPETANNKTVEDYRKSFYGAYGRFWIALPVALIVYGVSSATTNASNYSGNINMYNNAVLARNISIGSAVIAGGFLIESLIRFGIYLYKSNSTGVEKINK
jgi:hypothetical protein